MARPSVHRPGRAGPRASMLRAPSPGVKTGPPLPGELLAELLALVGRGQRRPRSRRAAPGDRAEAAAHRRLPDPRHLPAGPSRASWCRRTSRATSLGLGGALPRAARRGHRGRRGGDARAGLRARRLAATRATSRSSRGWWPSSRIPLVEPGPAGRRPEHRGPRVRALHAGGAHRAPGAGRATSRSRSRTRRSTARRAGTPDCSRRSTRSARRPRRSSTSTCCCSALAEIVQARDRLRDVRDPAARRGAAGAGAAQGGATSARPRAAAG